MDTQKTAITKGSVDVLTLKLKRVASGLQLYAKSAVIEDFMAGRNRSGYEESHLGLLLYQPTNSSTIGLYLNRTNGIMESDTPALWILRAKGLRDGVTVTVPNVCSESQAREFINGAQEQVRQFYKDYCRPWTFSFELRARETVHAEIEA